MRRLGSIVKSGSSILDWQAFKSVRSCGQKCTTLEALRYLWTSSELHREIVELLQLGERPRASLLLSKLGSRDETLQSGDFISILGYCARKPDPMFAMATWKAMRAKDVQIDGKCYFLTFRALCKGGCLKEAVNMLHTQGENSETHSTLPFHNHLLGGSIQMNNLSVANECLHMMDQHFIGKNAKTYSHLLELAVLQQDLQTALKIWQKYISCYGLSILTLQKFVRAFAMLRDPESAYMALQHIVSLSLRKNFYSAKFVDGRLLESSPDIPIPFHDESCQITCAKTYPLPVFSEDHLEEELYDGVKSAFERKNSEPHRSYFLQQPFSQHFEKLLMLSFNDVIYACANSQNDLLAEKLMLQMQSLDLKPSCGTYDGFIKALVSVRSFQHGIEALNVMQQKGLKPYNSTLAALSASCSKGFQLDLAEKYMVQISKSREVYPFNDFLEACSALDRPDRAVQALSKMKSLCIKPNIRTYELLFALFANVNAPYENGNLLSQVVSSKRIKAIEMDMMRHGIQHSFLSFRNLLKALGMEGMTQQMVQRFANCQFLYLNDHVATDIYNTVLHMLIEAQKFDMAIEVFNSMSSSGSTPNETTYGIMIDCCSIMKFIQPAWALLSLMFRRGFCLDTMILTAFVKNVLISGDFGEALKLINLAVSEGVQPDVILYNTILRTASKMGRIDVMEMIVERMHREKIHPDPTTCSIVFSTYVDMGLHNTGMEALHVLCMRMLAEEDSVLEEYRVQYESVITDEGSEVESRIIDVFGDSPYRAHALLGLRLCALNLLPLSWSPNRSQWAKQLSSDYSSTCFSLSRAYK